MQFVCDSAVAQHEDTGLDAFTTNIDFLLNN